MRISDAFSAPLLGCALFAAACAGSHFVATPEAGAAAPRADDARDAAVDETTAFSAGPVDPPDPLCTQLASLQCGAEQHCCTDPGRDLATCQKAVRDECAQSLYLDAVAANALAGFDMERASAVFLQFAQRSGDCDPEVARWTVSHDGVRSIFRGTIAAGQSCKSPQVLTSDRATQVAALVSCVDPETTACLPQTLLGDWTCAPKGTTGTSCLTDDNCQEDAYCSNPEQAPLGQCQPRAAEGEACTDSNQCASLFCKDNACRTPDVQEAYCPAP